MQKLMFSNETFDLLLYEIFINDALIGLGQHFNVPTIGFSTLGTSRWVQEYTGSPLPASHLAHFLLGFSDHMNFFERFINAAMNLYEDIVFPVLFYPQMEKIYDQHFSDPKPSFHDLRKSAMALALLNTHISMRGAQPLMTNVIECGGMHLKSKLDLLPENLQKFLDSATDDGVIYFSLGSNMRPEHLGEVRRAAVIKVLSEVKAKVVWNWNHESAKEVDQNKFFTANWLPQNEILAHPNVKLFITHGGLLSLMEAVYYGVPVVGFAIFADQKYNLMKAFEDGYGELVDFTNLTESSLRWAVNQVMNDLKYQTKAKEVSQRFRDRPMNGTETAKFWIEYVLRHNGAKYLQSPALKLNLFQYYNLDVIGTLLLGVFIACFTVKVMVVKMVKFIRSTSTLKTDDSKPKPKKVK